MEFNTESHHLISAVTVPYLFRHDMVADHAFPAVSCRWMATRSARDVDLAAALTPPGGDDPAEGSPLPDHTRRLLRLLKHWKQLANQPTPSLRIELAARAVQAASDVVRAACVARDALVHESPAVSQLVVADFVTTWLGLRPTSAMVEAAGNALLQASLTPSELDGNPDLIRQLRCETRRQHRAWRPVGETLRW